MQTRIVFGLTSVMLAALAVTLAFAVGASPAHAMVHKFEANLDEAQAIGTCPVNPAPPGGGGSAVVVYDDVSNLLTWSVTFTNLSGVATAAHFHRDPDSIIRVDMSSDLTSPMQGSATLSGGQKAAMETELLSDDWYINIHTTACGAGEIRGQVLPMTVGGVSKLPGIDSSETTPLAQPEDSGTSAWFIAAIASASVAMVAVLGGSFVLARRRSLR